VRIDPVEFALQQLDDDKLYGGTETHYSLLALNSRSGSVPNQLLTFSPGPPSNPAGLRGQGLFFLSPATVATPTGAENALWTVFEDAYGRKSLGFKGENKWILTGPWWNNFTVTSTTTIDTDKREIDGELEKRAGVQDGYGFMPCGKCVDDVKECKRNDCYGVPTILELVEA
jgi:hypothetical protein